MDYIFKKENVYIAFEDVEIQNDKNFEDSLIYDSESKNMVSLYGNRVQFKLSNKQNGIKLEVDGIKICQIELDESSNRDYIIKKELKLHKVAAFLTQIENLGIDTFLENYRNQLQSFKTEIEKTIEQIQEEQALKYDDNKNSTIYVLRKFVKELTCLIFCLLINMNAGLDNQCYIDAYNTIFNLYF